MASGLALTTGPRRLAYYGIVHQLLPMGAGAAGADDPVQVDGQADFLIREQRAIYQDGQDRVNFRIGSGRYLASQPFPISALGAGQFPAVMPWKGRLIPRATSFTMLAWDRKAVAGTNNLRVLHSGMKVYSTPFERARAYERAEPYRYVANFTAQDENAVGPLAANGALTGVLALDGDADFDIYAMTVLADDPRITLQVQMASTGVNWWNRAAHGLLLGATAFNAAIPAGGTPLWLPRPTRLPATGAISVDATDLSGAQNRVQVIFHGLRCSPPGGLPILMRADLGTDEEFLGNDRLTMLR